MRIKNLSSFLSIIMISIMLVFSAKLYPIKILILGYLFLAFVKKTYVSKQVLFLWACLVFSFLWGLIIGVLKGTDYPLANITIEFLWPTLALIIVLPQLKRNEDFNNLFYYLFYIHTFIIIYDILYAFHMIFGFPFYNLYPEIEKGFTFYGTTSRLNLDDNLNVLSFTMPMYFLIWLTKYDIKINRLFQTIMVVAGFFLMIISGRRSLMLIFFLAPLLVIFIGHFYPRETVSSIRKYFSFFLILLTIVIMYMISFEPDMVEGYTNTFLMAFNSDEESTKFSQARMLWDHFCENPICGEGSGAVLYESDRGIRQHQYELTYLLQLATKGVIGFIFYFFAIFGVLIFGLKFFVRKKDVVLLTLLFGYLFVLIANGTNPVLSSFDLMLPLYFCYARINYLALHNNKKI